MKILCAVLLLAASSVVAQEQPSLRRGVPVFLLGGPGSAPPPEFIMRRPIQQELGLSAQAVHQLEEARDELQKTLRVALSPRDASILERARGKEAMEEARKKFENRVNEILDDGQQERLLQLYLQVAGVGAVLQPDIAEKLKLSEEQKTKLQELIKSVLRDGFNMPRGLARVQTAWRRNAAQNEEIAAVLTKEQNLQFENLKGKYFDIRLMDEFYPEYPTPKPAKADEVSGTTTKWEYRVVSGQDGTAEDLNRYGDQGWELVSVISVGDDRGNFRNQRFYFKRPKPAATTRPRPEATAEPSNRQAGPDERVRRWAEGIVKSFDSDKNGELSNEEIGDRSNLTRFDLNGDGKLSAAEIVEALKSVKEDLQ